MAREQGHLRVDVLERMMPSAARAISNAIFHLLQLGASTFIAFGAVKIIISLGHTRTPAIGMPIAVFFTPTLIGFSLLAIESLRQFLIAVISARNIATSD